MEGRTTLRKFKWIVFLASWIKSVPFELCPGDGLTVRLYESKWKMMLWKLGAGAVGFNSVIQLLRLGNVLLTDGLTSLQPAHLFYVLVTCLAAIFTGSLAYGPHEAVAWINGIQEMVSSGSEKVSAKAYFATRMVKLTTFYLAAISIFVMTTLLMAFNIIAPNDGMHLSAYLSDDYLRMWKVAISVLFKAVECVWMSSQWTVVWMLWQGSITTTINLSNAIRRVTKREGWKELGRVVRLYRQLQLLNVLHNAFNGPIFTWACQLFCLTLVAVFAYGSITFIHRLPVLMYAVFPLGTSFGLFMQIWFYLHVGYMEVASGQAISEMQKESFLAPLGIRRVEVEALKREIRGLRRCSSKVGSIGNHNLVHTRFINEWTLSILLLLKSN